MTFRHEGTGVVRIQKVARHEDGLSNVEDSRLFLRCVRCRFVSALSRIAPTARRRCRHRPPSQQTFERMTPWSPIDDRALDQEVARYVAVLADARENRAGFTGRKEPFS